MPASSLAKKLGMKSGMRIAIINPPEGYVDRLGTIPEAGTEECDHPGEYDFIQIFVSNEEDLRRFTRSALSSIAEDGILWYTYPKKSGSIASSITRDRGWDILTKAGYRPVAAVSVDDNWSCLRFRPVESVKRKTVKTPHVDTATRTVTLPPDFSKLLKANRQALERFSSLSYSHMKEYVLWIESAKKPETRKTRMRKTIAMLAGKTARI
jgi:hypothetical protein